MKREGHGNEFVAPYEIESSLTSLLHFRKMEAGNSQLLSTFERGRVDDRTIFFKLAIFTDVCIPGWQPCRTVIQSSVNLMFLKKEISHSICKAFLFDFLQEPNCTVATNLSYPQGLAGKFNSVILCQRRTNCKQRLTHGDYCSATMAKSIDIYIYTCSPPTEVYGHQKIFISLNSDCKFTALTRSYKLPFLKLKLRPWLQFVNLIKSKNKPNQ